MDRSHARAVRSCGGGAVKFLSLFAGIGGLDLGLERAGWQCVGQVEIDPFATAVLAKHWPDVRRWSDVREITASDIVGSVGRPDAIVGGFPCQPWSVAGKQRGADDPRHLWPEYYRLIRELRPRWVLGENVPGLLSKGADAVLADLEAAGYTCWPIVLGADDVGAPHKRRRVFFVARLADADIASRRSNTRCVETPRTNEGSKWDQSALEVGRGRADVADAVRARSQAGLSTPPPQGPWVAGEFDDRGTGRRGVGADAWPARPGEPQHPWEEPRAVEPEVGGATDGIPRRLAGWRTGALKGLGNAVVPQVAEVIGRAIMEADRE